MHSNILNTPQRRKRPSLDKNDHNNSNDSEAVSGQTSTFCGDHQDSCMDNYPEGNHLVKTIRLGRHCQLVHITKDYDVNEHEDTDSSSQRIPDNYENILIAKPEALRDLIKEESNNIDVKHNDELKRKGTEISEPTDFFKATNPEFEQLKKVKQISDSCIAVFTNKAKQQLVMQEKENTLKKDSIEVTRLKHVAERSIKDAPILSRESGSIAIASARRQRGGELGWRLSLNISFAMEALRLGHSLTGVMSQHHVIARLDEKIQQARSAGWSLVDVDGRKTTLSPMNLTVGGTQASDVYIEGAEYNHALLIYSAKEDKYKIQDLDSNIGTYVNDSRIPAEIPVTLQNMDSVTFGQDAMTYRVEQLLEHVSEDSSQCEEEAAEIVETDQISNKRSTEELSVSSDTSQDMASHGTSSHTSLSIPEKSETAEQQLEPRRTSIHQSTSPNPVASSQQQKRPPRRDSDSKSECAKKPVTSQQECAHKTNTMTQGNCGRHGVPTWAQREHHRHHLAECPGCIAEQGIRHTCDGHLETEEDDETSEIPAQYRHTHAHHNQLPSRPTHLPTLPPGAPPTSIYSPHTMPYPPVDYRDYVQPQHHHRPIQNGGKPGVTSPDSSPDDGKPTVLYNSSKFRPSNVNTPPEDGAPPMLYNSPKFTSSHSSYALHHYSGSAFEPVTSVPSTQPSTHEAIQTKMKRSKSAHLEFEMSHNFSSYPGPSDPYHYAQGYSTGLPPSSSYTGACHPPHGYYPPPPQSHPGYPRMYDGRGYAPPPHGCHTCAALIAQLGYIPLDHLHDHSLRQAQGTEERAAPYRDYYHYQQHSQHPHHPPSIRYPTPSDISKPSHMQGPPQERPPQHTHSQHNKTLVSTCVGNEEGEEDSDLISDIDMTAFSGSKHQGVSFSLDKQSEELRGANDKDGANRDTGTKSSEKSHYTQSPTSTGSKPETGLTGLAIPETTTSAKTRELFAKLDSHRVGLGQSVAGAPHNSTASVSVGSSTVLTVGGAGIYSSSPATHTNCSPGSKMSPFSDNRLSNTVASIAAQSVSNNSHQQALNTVPAASCTSIDENIPERDTNVGLVGTTNSLNKRKLPDNNFDTDDRNGATKSAIKDATVNGGNLSQGSGESPSLPRKDQRGNIIDKPVDYEALSLGMSTEDHSSQPSAMDILLGNATLPRSSNPDPTHTPPERDTGPNTIHGALSDSERSASDTVAERETCKEESANVGKDSKDTEDSVKSPPPPRRGSSMAFTIDFGAENIGGKAVDSAGSKTVDEPAQPAAPPTAFTIDFGGSATAAVPQPGERKTKRQLSMDGSLSQFLPTKVRQSFRSRQQEAGKPGKRSEDEDGANQEETDSTNEGSQNTSIGRQWQSPSSIRKSSLKQTTPVLARRTGYLSDGAHSTMSSDNEDISLRSDYVTTRSNRKPSLPKSAQKTAGKPEVSFNLMSPEKPGISSVRYKPISSSDSKVTRPATSTSRNYGSSAADKSRVLRSKSAGITLGKGSAGNETLLNREVSFDDSVINDGTHPPSEFALYREAKMYDKIIKSGSAQQHASLDTSVKKSPDTRPTRRSRNKKAENYLRSRSVPRTLPVPDDDVSEAGTYTIDVDNGEMQKARRSIDAIFNVPGRSAMLGQKILMQTNTHILNEDFVPPIIDATDINANLANTTGNYPQARPSNEDVHIEVSYDAPSGRSPVAADNTPQQQLSGSANVETDSLFVSGRSLDTNSSALKSRRVLPTPPDSKPGSQANSSVENSPRTPRTTSTDSVILEVDSELPGRRTGSVTVDENERGECFTVSFDAPEQRRVSTPEMKDVAYTAQADRPKYTAGANVDEFLGIWSSPKRGERRARNKPVTEKPISSLSAQLKVDLPVDINYRFSRSPAASDTQRTDYLLGEDLSPRYNSVPLDTGRSIDTQVLLQDTEDVMKALEQRKPSRTTAGENTSKSRSRTADFDVFDFGKFSHAKRSDDLKAVALDQRSNSDTSSTSGLVDEPLVHNAFGSKPPRQPASSASGARNKPVSTKDRAMGYTYKTSHSSVDYYAASDGHESEDTGSIASSGTDYSHGRQVTSPLGGRKNSVDGKSGNINNTRTNRAFALRRSRNPDGDSSAVTTPSTAKSSTNRSTANDTARTDASLGTKIVQKSRENSAKVKRGETLTRKDGGRFSLRATSAGCNKKQNWSAKATNELSKPRASRAVNPPSSSTTKTTPAPALTGKKAEEHDNWKRRSKYDPRKAIEEAKAREQERQKRARSAGNTPECDSGRYDSASEDSIALGAESISMSGIEADAEQGEDEITRLSSTIASDMSLLTAIARDDEAGAHLQEVSFRSSAFTSVRSGSSGTSAFTASSKTLVSNGGGPLHPLAAKAGPAASTPETESYDPVLVASVHQISQQVKAQADRLLFKLNEDEGVPSPLDELVASHSANPELASTLQNLKAIEHSLKVVNNSLFPSSEGSSPRDPELHHLEMDRIRNELSGFKPITKSTPSLFASTSKDAVSLKISQTGKRDSKYGATGSMTSLTKTSKSSVKSRSSYTRTKDSGRYGTDYF